MNKDELIKKVSQTSGVSPKNTKVVVASLMEIIKQSLKNGEEIRISGFGKFEVKKRAERVSINPRTKERMQIPSMRVPAFKVGKDLRDAVSG